MQQTIWCSQRQCIYCSRSTESMSVACNKKYIFIFEIQKGRLLGEVGIILMLVDIWKGSKKLLYAESFSVATSLCQCDIHLLEAVLHKQTTPKATTGWLNNHRLFSLFSTIAHWKFLVGPPHALLRLSSKQLTRPVKFTSHETSD